MNCFWAKKEVEFAEEVYKATQSDDIKEIIKRAALLKIIQKKV